jgi:tetraacyldisaccharide-1-P 4'-kinase
MHFTDKQHLYLFNHSHHYRNKDEMSDWLRSKNPNLCYAWIDYQFVGYRLGYDDELLDLNLLKNKRICLLTAVAMAQRLKIALAHFGLEIEQTLTFRDHFDFREDEALIQRLTDINLNTNGNDALIYLSTFKDRVKLKDSFQIYYLEIKIIPTRPVLKGSF